MFGFSGNLALFVRFWIVVDYCCFRAEQKSSS